MPTQQCTNASLATTQRSENWWRVQQHRGGSPEGTGLWLSHAAQAAQTLANRERIIGRHARHGRQRGSRSASRPARRTFLQNLVSDAGRDPPASPSPPVPAADQPRSRRHSPKALDRLANCSLRIPQPVRGAQGSIDRPLMTTAAILNGKV